MVVYKKKPQPPQTHSMVCDTIVEDFDEAQPRQQSRVDLINKMMKQVMSGDQAAVSTCQQIIFEDETDSEFELEEQIGALEPGSAAVELNNYRIATVQLPI